MKYFNMIIVVTLILLTQNSFSTNYYCPRTPIEIKIGETINNDWFIWENNVPINFLTKTFYKFNISKYKFDSWFSMISGISENKPGHFIACCGRIKNSKREVCAYKYIKENNCDSDIRAEPNLIFICSDN